MSGHAPQLAGQLDRRCLAVGAGHRGDAFGRRCEEPGGEPGEGAARFGIGDMHRAIHSRFAPRNDGNRASGNGGGDEVLAVDRRALERTEHGSRRNLAVIDGEAANLFVRAARQRQSCGTGELPQLHLAPPPTRGDRSEISMSRVSSGMMPSSGPMRGTTRPTIGAVFQAAVRWPDVAAVPWGSSSMAITT